MVSHCQFTFQHQFSLQFGIASQIAWCLEPFLDSDICLFICKISTSLMCQTIQAMSREQMEQDGTLCLQPFRAFLLWIFTFGSLLLCSSFHSKSLFFGPVLHMSFCSLFLEPTDVLETCFSTDSLVQLKVACYWSFNTLVQSIFGNGEQKVHQTRLD